MVLVAATSTPAAAAAAATGIADFNSLIAGPDYIRFFIFYLHIE